MRDMITKVALVLSGILLVSIGGALLLVPRGFLEASQVSIGADPSLLSEMVAPSGILLMVGAFMILGAGNTRFAKPALIVGALAYGSYGAGRLVSIALNGVPSQPLINATLLELLIAATLAVLGLCHTRAAAQAQALSTLKGKDA